MSFNKNEIQTNQKITPLKEDKQNDFFILQSKFLNFIKTYEEISEYEVKLEKLSIKDYEKIKEDIHNKIQSVPDILRSIMSSMINLNKESKLQSSVLEQIDIINRKLEAKRENLSNLINSIVAKEKRLAKRISANKGETNLTVSNTFSSFDSKRSNLIDTSEIEVKDIIDNKDYLSRRQNELEEIKVISSQIREMSISMQSDTIRQRNDLSQIEHDINQANSFAHKTELEMQIAEKDTRASNRRMWCIVLFVFFTAVAVVTLLFLLIPKSS